mmetsp:Transcript_9873/g.26265  ORF Transcript_9873/g.26265 Transcript_9873/m.26265 type:complete len:92 (+) Transcript_9873:56-331(+)
MTARWLRRRSASSWVRCAARACLRDGQRVLAGVMGSASAHQAAVTNVASTFHAAHAKAAAAALELEALTEAKAEAVWRQPSRWCVRCCSAS